PGVEASTGALGHGLSIGVGLAISAKISKKKHKIVVLTGDGEINEGSVWEAAMSASKHRLSNLSLWIDYNKLQSYGPTSEVMELEPLADKLKSFGFETFEVDGHDVSKIKLITDKVTQVEEKPSAVICHTIKGKGIPFAENNPSWHHQSYLSDEQMKQMYESLI
nr:transketolase [Gammaproteobacteria bacterium]